MRPPLGTSSVRRTSSGCSDRVSPSAFTTKPTIKGGYVSDNSIVHYLDVCTSVTTVGGNDFKRKTVSESRMRKPHLVSALTPNIKRRSTF